MTNNIFKYIGGVLGLVKLGAYVYGCITWGWSFVIVGALLALTLEHS